MDWSINVKRKIHILENVARKNLENVKLAKRAHPSYKSLHDENAAKITLLNHLRANDEWNDEDSFVQLLDKLHKKPIKEKVKVFDDRTFTKYWKSYTSLLKQSNFDDF